jgi:MATE family multidrug resistance protein
MNKEILKLAIPNILSNISIPLLSSVDTLLMGNLSTVHLGAVGIGSMIFNIIYWNFGFLRMGTTGMTAQAYGGKNELSMTDVLLRAIILAALISVCLLLFSTLIQKATFWSMNVQADQLAFTKSYFYIRLYAAPATMSLFVLMGWFFGMQNAWFPLMVTLVINIANIGISYYCVAILGMEVIGVAWGTVIAQYIGLVIAVVSLFWKYPFVLQHVRKVSLAKFDSYRSFLTVNRDIFLRTIMLTFTFGFFHSKSSEMGEMILAANLILLQFVNWMSYGIDGFAYAAESLVGKYKGANNNVKLKKVINYLLIWGAILAMLYSLIYAVFGNYIIDLYTNDTDLIQFTSGILYWAIIIPIIAFLSYIWDGIYIGLTASTAMRNTMLVAFIFFLLAYFICEYLGVGNFGLWISLAVFLLFRGILQSILYYKKGFNLN